MAVDVVNFTSCVVHSEKEDGSFVTFGGGESVYGTASYGYVRRLLEMNGVSIPEINRFERPDIHSISFVDSDTLSRAVNEAIEVLKKSSNPVVDGKLLFESLEEEYNMGKSYAERQHEQTLSLLLAMQDWSARGLSTAVLV